MPEVVTFTLGVIAIMATWTFMLRPSIQDTHKDQLFDVRDSLRDFFAQRVSLGTPEYVELRNVMNQYIRFIERAGFTVTLIHSRALDKRPDLAELVRERMDKIFDLQDPELKAAALAAREKSCRIMQSYVFHASIFTVALIYLVIMPLVFITSLFRSRKLGKRHAEAFEDRVIPCRYTESLSMSPA